MASKKSIFKRYRLLPLVSVGMALSILLSVCGILLWSFITFNQLQDIPEKSRIPSLIYLGSVFISCIITTALIRGGTVFPSAVIAVAYCTLSLLLQKEIEFTVLFAIGKYALTLLVAIAGFSLCKLCFLAFAIRKKKVTTPQPKDEAETLRENFN